MSRESDIRHYIDEIFIYICAFFPFKFPFIFPIFWVSPSFSFRRTPSRTRALHGRIMSRTIPAPSLTCTCTSPPPPLEGIIHGPLGGFMPGNPSLWEHSHHHHHLASSLCSLFEHGLGWRRCDVGPSSSELQDSTSSSASASASLEPSSLPAIGTSVVVVALKVLNNSSSSVYVKVQMQVVVEPSSLRTTENNSQPPPPQQQPQQQQQFFCSSIEVRVREF